MKKLHSLVVLVAAVSVLSSTIAVLAQNNVAAWPFSVEVNAGSGSPGMYDVIVPFAVFDKSRPDLADLRLFDVNNREIPYAIHVRQETSDREPIDATIFNEATIGSTSEVTLDLGEEISEHNEIELKTSGNNFRRRVDIEGSDSPDNWRTLETGAVIFAFYDQNSSVESKRISYPASRYRYLRVRVFSDEVTDKSPPEVEDASVLMAVHEKEELSTWSVPVPKEQYLRNQGAPASSWNIDLGARVPCDRIQLEVSDESFARHFVLENIDDQQHISAIAQGELVRRSDEQGKPLVIHFDDEEYVRKLRLVIDDYSNQTLSLTSISASAPARQLIFELKEPVAQPLKLYFGNQKIEAPHYDFEKDLAARLTSQPTRITPGPAVTNPSFVPEPLPLTERVPWLIYLVLAASGVALAFILWKLAQKTLQSQEPTKQEDSELHKPA